MSVSTTPLIDPELFKIYCFWGSVLAIKLIAMVPLTAYQRFTKRVFANPGDAAYMKHGKVSYTNEDVERVRRSHLNDLENIPMWYVVTLLWLTTKPSVFIASILCKTFVFARILHTLSYAVYPIQPHRALAFFVGLFITVYQAISTLLYYW